MQINVLNGKGKGRTWKQKNVTKCIYIYCKGKSNDYDAYRYASLDANATFKYDFLQPLFVVICEKMDIKGMVSIDEFHNIRC